MRANLCFQLYEVKSSPSIYLTSLLLKSGLLVTVMCFLVENVQHFPWQPPDHMRRPHTPEPYTMKSKVPPLFRRGSVNQLEQVMGSTKKNRKKWKACSVLKGHKQPSLACFYVPALCACWNKTLIILQLSCIVLHSLNIFFTFFLSVNAALTPVLFAPITVALLSDGMVPVGKGLMQPAHFYFARSTKAHSIADRTDWSESTEFFF